MTIQAVTTVQFQIVGGLGGVDNIQEQMTAPANSNAPPPGGAQLQPGSNTIQVPSGFTVQCCTIKPPTGSTNAKAVMGNSADVGLTGWTACPLIVPCVAGGTFVINSAGSETLEMLWG